MSTLPLQDYLDHVASGQPIVGGSEVHRFMHGLTREALRLTAELNSGCRTPEELRTLFSRLIGQPVDDRFTLLPPFYTNCGKNIHLGQGVYINMNCQFQDQGGIYIGDETLIGHHATLVTLNHDLDPDRRSTVHPKPIHIGNRVWLGANVTVLPGVTIGDGAVIGAGSVVTRDVPPNTVAAGNPARVLREVREGNHG